MITDTEKFLIMTKVYNDIFEGDKKFALKIGASKSNVNYWRNQKTKSIKTTLYRVNICNVFGLTFDVWTKDFSTMDSFRKELPNMKKIRNSTNKLDGYIMENNEIENRKFDALFEEAKECAGKKEIAKALNLINQIENSDSKFFYQHKNEILHKKAILLSTDEIRDWTQAIMILKDLYFSAHYHLEKHEVVTLIASNYKRKALFDKDGEYYSIEDIRENQLDLLGQSLTLYYESYELKDSQEKYYDAINFAYLYKIVQAIEGKEIEDNRVNELYKELKQIWRIDYNSWWEVVSNAEFLMLTSQTQKAILEVERFLNDTDNSVNKLDMDGTLRQLKIYIHFIQDENAINFFNFLDESWKAIQKN